MKCNIPNCNNKVNVRKLKVGQTHVYNEIVNEVYCSEEHWQQHLKEVMPHH